MTIVLPTQEMTIASAERSRLRILVRGAVQGVGFRPFVYRQATALGLAGWVSNSGEGVVLEAEGDRGALSIFVDAIQESPPPNATVGAVEICEIEAVGEVTFAIRPSEIAGSRGVEVLPDIATCPECLAELFAPSNRRYCYPFINCTHCGPRYSIIEDLPYDRARTTMRRFPMCSSCRAEYEDPRDRRFHAEPNACLDCGPRLALWDPSGRTLARDHKAVLAAAAALRHGQIIAVKGTGGFHLFADARNEHVVRRLRASKRRESKPFAVMFSSLSAVEASCHVRPQERALLTGQARPIVLLRRTGEPVVHSVAPGSLWLGVLLPYAPVHHLLVRELGFPVVATSGNVTDEPIVIDETEATDRLAGIADTFLVHDRPIVRPIDDSVVRVVCGRELVLRRARGYAPAPIAVNQMPAGILALGGHLKTTVALTLPGGAVLSQHVGDLETVAARKAHGRVIADTIRLHRARPYLVVRDQHPDYASSRAAEELGLPILAVQHHVAHVAACMGEHGVAPPALGVAWDGSGYGPDGTIWGGEFILVNTSGWHRVGHLRPFRLPGGEAGVREPRRAALGLLYAAFAADAFVRVDLPPVAAFSAAERFVLQRMLASGIGAPVTSSAGRLFDAFASICGLRQSASFEGQAATELEWAAEGRSTGLRYEFTVRPLERGGLLIVDWQPALEAALDELQRSTAVARVSEALHNGLAAAIVEVAMRIGQRRVILTGGCFQNARLTEATVAALRDRGCEPVWHRRVPPNDGGLALGQAVWAGWVEQRSQTPCA